MESARKSHVKPPRKKSAVLEYNFRQACANLPSTTYSTHCIHSFPAKFIPHIPHYYIKNYTNIGDTILDSFMGSGTTLVEAKLLGRSSYGIDMIPLARLIAKVKTTPIRYPLLHKEIKTLLEKLENFEGEPDRIDFPNKDFWFNQQAQEKLAIIKRCIREMKEVVAPEVYDFFLVCFSSIIRKSCNADPKISKPFISRHMRDKLAHGLKFNTMRDFRDTLWTYADRIRDFTEREQTLPWHNEVFAEVLEHSDARAIQLKNETVDLVVTSPPYVNAQEYLRSIKLELFWLGLADNHSLQEMKQRLVGTESISQGTYRELASFGLPSLDKVIEEIYKKDKRRSYTVYKYFADMEMSVAEIYRVLKSRGRFCIVVGDNVIRKISVLTHQYITSISERAGFKTVEVGYDVIKARALSPVRHETAGLIDVEWVLLFRK